MNLYCRNNNKETMSRDSTQAHPQMPAVQLTQDEKRVLAECEKESLIYRSIPLGLLTFFATQYGMQRNIISQRAKWLKIGLSLFTGYILGKVSYAPTCRNKILSQIPNSNLAYAIRGIDARHAAAEDSPGNQDLTAFTSQKHRDPSEAVVFVPDPVELDTHIAPVGVNQYGDPIYDVRK